MEFLVSLLDPPSRTGLYTDVWIIPSFTRQDLCAETHGWDSKEQKGRMLTEQHTQNDKSRCQVRRSVVSLRSNISWQSLSSDVEAQQDENCWPKEQSSGYSDLKIIIVSLLFLQIWENCVNKGYIGQEHQSVQRWVKFFSASQMAPYVTNSYLISDFRLWFESCMVLDWPVGTV